MPKEQPLSDVAKASLSSSRECAVLPSRNILGIAVSVATTQEALSLLDDRLQKHEPTSVAFFNANTSNLAASQPRLETVLRKCIVFSDGIGADIASRVLYGAAFPENMNGTDFVPFFLRNTRHVLRIFILGGHPDIAQRATDVFRRLAPQHQYVGMQHGYFQPNEIPAIIEMIKGLQADVILIALGTPLQEFWLADHFSATQCRLGFCVGGLLDFVSGAKPRAPLWFRRNRLEWIYRLMVEPSRMWRRYLIGNILFLARLARSAIAKQHR